MRHENKKRITQFQGFLCANVDCCPNENMLVKLWLHESSRVYGDKLTNEADLQAFSKLLNETLSKNFDSIKQDVVLHEPNIFFHFAESLNDSKYMPVKDWESLSKTLESVQAGYKEIVGDMNLVLFEDAMSHICRYDCLIAFLHLNCEINKI